MSSSINPENPYVLNENYYENTTHVVFKETTFYLIFRTSFILSALFSLLSIGLVVFLVIFKTPKPFKLYSNMLLIYAMTDFYIELAEFLIQSRLRVTNDITIFSLTGPFSYLSYRTQCYMIGWQGSALLLSNTCIPVQYYVRLKIINNKSPSNLRVLFYFLIAIFLAFPPFYLSPIMFCSFDNPNQVDFSQYWHSENPMPKLLVGIHSHPSHRLFLAYLFIIQFSSYISSIILARKSLAEIKRKSFSPKTRALQEQFSRTLFAQSLFPLITVILPPVITLLLIPFFGIRIDNFGDYLIMIFSWSPVLNSITTIVLIVPYRNYCIELLSFWKRNLVGSSSTAVVPISSTMVRA